MNDPVFLGEHGITSTQGNYLCNLAQELIVKDRELLEGAVFYNGYVDVVGATAPSKQVMVGKTEDYVKNIPTILNRIAKMNAFCAWVREAIKAKDILTREIDSMSSHEWQPDRVPQRPMMKTVNSNDFLGTLDIKERCEYLTLEAYASAIGRAIHSDGTINKARKDAHKMEVQPVQTSGTGTDTLIYTYGPSVDLGLVDSVYEQLQNTQRQYEARLNAIKFRLQEKAAAENLRLKEEYQTQLAEYESATTRLTADFYAWRTAEKQRISKLKIRIPNELQETFEYLNSVGNKVADS